MIAMVQMEKWELPKLPSPSEQVSHLSKMSKQTPTEKRVIEEQDEDHSQSHWGSLQKHAEFPHYLQIFPDENFHGKTQKP